MARTSPSTDDAAESLGEVRADVRSLAASPLPYVGALTVVLSNEVVELSPLTDLPAMAAIFVTTLALLYGQLAVLSYFGWANADGCC
jgi:hypothetical protein